MKKFEYRIFEPPKSCPADEFISVLNLLGTDGWELCCHEYGVFIFKRELKP